MVQLKNKTTIGSFTIKQINKSSWFISEAGLANIFLIVGKKKALLIDTGWGIGNLKYVVRRITDLPLMVVNSHAHPDHIYGNIHFERNYIYISDRNIEKKYKRNRNKIDLLLLILKMKSLKTFLNINKYQKNRKSIYLMKNTIISLGDIDIEILHFPGHTQGSIILLDRTNRVLYSGDSICKEIWLCLPESLSVDIYRESLKMIKSKIELFDVVYSGHDEALLNKEIIDKHIKLCNLIINNSLRGEPYITLFTRGEKFSYENISIVLKSNIINLIVKTVLKLIRQIRF